MRALRVACVAAVLCALAMAVPATASAFTILDTSTEATANAYGLWYAGEAKCASPDCHKSIADVATVHGEMVTDVQASPQKLVPGLGSGLWPVPNPFDGPSLNPSDMYLQVGDRHGLLEYAGASGAYPTKPSGDLPLWSPVGFEIALDEWEPVTAEVKASAYFQSCGQCHNLGVTRPSRLPYSLPNGATQTSDTPVAIAGLSIQCEVCHGTGTDPAVKSHKDGVPAVVSGPQLLKAQVCGQCHVTGTTAQENFTSTDTTKTYFSNPNGYTTDEDLSLYFTPRVAVSTEASMMAFVTGVPKAKKPDFLPNGANYSLRHSYYNEWLLNRGSSGYGHVAPLNNRVTDTKCLGCHSGLGFLSRIGASYPSTDGVHPGAKIQTDTPSITDPIHNEVGISCQVCHTGHVGYDEYGGYTSQRAWGTDSAHPGKTVDCSDCHNWQFEVLGQGLQAEDIAGETYARPSVDQRVRHPQREMLKGGFGGDSGTGGMWGVGPIGTEMGSTSCKDCHMPRTAKEGGTLPSNSNDTGEAEATRMSHRFHPVLPGDAKRWNLRPNGDSCVAECHKDEASEWNRDQFQAWIDEVQATVSAKSDEATVALGAVASEYGLSAWSKFIAPQPADPDPASGISTAEWTMLQRAAQNVDFVVNDASNGVHNAKYAEAGLDKAAFWATSFDPAFTILVADGYRNGSAGVDVAGSLRGNDGAIIEGATVTLEASTDGGSSWETRGSADASATSFSLPSGSIAGDTTFRFAFSPAEGVTYYSDDVTISVPKTEIAIDPAQASMGWLDVASVAATLEAAPADAITFYVLSGAQASAPTVYGGPFSVSAEGATTITYWSVNANGTEALSSALIRLDRSAPTVGSDAKSVYLNSASIKVTGSDAVSPVSAVQYSLDGGSWVDTAGGTVTVTTSALGSHTLTARAVDSAGHISAERPWTFSVKATPTLAKSPNVSSLTKRRYQTQTFAVTMKRGTTPVAYKYVYLERSTNGRTWARFATLKTGSGGVAAKAVKFSARGYTYWRWTSPADGSYNLVRTSATRAYVK
jgi:hypothetical protein